MNWEFHTFNTLDTFRLFTLLKLRTDVFVVEQQCAYAELDDSDTLPGTLHVLGFNQRTLAAYARAMPETVNAATANNSRTTDVIRIGRVVVARSHRRNGLASQLMKRLMHQLDKTHPDRDQILSAQTAVVSFYQGLGFQTESEEYLEDGIAHRDMRKEAKSALAPAPAPLS